MSASSSMASTVVPPSRTVIVLTGRAEPGGVPAGGGIDAFGDTIPGTVVTWGSATATDAWALRRLQSGCPSCRSGRIVAGGATARPGDQLASSGGPVTSGRTTGVVPLEEGRGPIGVMGIRTCNRSAFDHEVRNGCGGVASGGARCRRAGTAVSG